MASKLWEKNVTVDHDVETYTVGRDREMDLYLARYDVLGSIAHITMLQTINLLCRRIGYAHRCPSRHLCGN